MFYQKKSLITVIVFCILYFANLAYSQPLFRPSFESAEHVRAGNKVILNLANNQPPKAQYQLHLPNGLVLTYGEILSLGDFYGAAMGPISLGESHDVRRLRFIAAFDSLARKAESFREVVQLMDIMNQEQLALDQGMEKGEKPEAIYARISDDLNRQYNCATGGGCTQFWYLQPGRYLKLAFQNIDHFNDNAWIAYQVGHEIAIELAIFAKETNDITKLEMAYAINAFASHFLSDRFASGHIRTPRAELDSEYPSQLTGILLSKYMHDEENHYGLYVHNAKDDQWIDYGDKNYYSTYAKETQKHMDDVLQESADQVYQAYLQGEAPKEDRVVQSIPFVDDSVSQNMTPLFKWDDKNKKMLRRKDMTNIYNKEMTADWWGWSTLLLLVEQRGISSPMQGLLALSTQGKEALQSGMIRDQHIAEYIKTHSR